MSYLKASKQQICGDRALRQDGLCSLPSLGHDFMLPFTDAVCARRETNFGDIFYLRFAYRSLVHVPPCMGSPRSVIRSVIRSNYRGVHYQVVTSRLH